MITLKNDLLGSKHTKVFHEKEFSYNAPHKFKVVDSEDENRVLGEVKFQEGPIKEHGINGIHNEDLIAMVICRLEHFNKTEFRCKENSMAITKLEESLLWLRKRTIGRENKGIEGTHKI